MHSRPVPSYLRPVVLGVPLSFVFQNSSTVCMLLYSAIINSIHIFLLTGLNTHKSSLKTVLRLSTLNSAETLLLRRLRPVSLLLPVPSKTSGILIHYRPVLLSAFAWNGTGRVHVIQGVCSELCPFRRGELLVRPLEAPQSGATLAPDNP